MRVWKYPLATRGITELDLPSDAEFLHLAEEDDGIVAWFCIHTALTFKRRRFVSVWTNENFEFVNGRYRGTVMQRSTGLVLHVFEVLEGEVS